jgi:hypothetical protein
LTAMTSSIVFSNLCSLCWRGNCSAPCLQDDYHEHVWYVNLGARTRYRDTAGRSGSARRSIIWFPFDTVAVVGLGDAAPKFDDAMISTPCFLFFDRKHIHRVLHELCSGNSLCADRYTVSIDNCSLHKDDHQAVRARWSRCNLP